MWSLDSIVEVQACVTGHHALDFFTKLPQACAVFKLAFDPMTNMIEIPCSRSIILDNAPRGFAGKSWFADELSHGFCVSDCILALHFRLKRQAHSLSWKHDIHKGNPGQALWSMNRYGPDTPRHATFCVSVFVSANRGRLKHTTQSCFLDSLLSWRNVTQSVSVNLIVLMGCCVLLNVLQQKSFQYQYLGIERACYLRKLTQI